MHMFLLIACEQSTSFLKTVKVFEQYIFFILFFKEASSAHKAYIDPNYSKNGKNLKYF